MPVKDVSDLPVCSLASVLSSRPLSLREGLRWAWQICKMLRELLWIERIVGTKRVPPGSPQLFVYSHEAEH